MLDSKNSGHLPGEWEMDAVFYCQAYLNEFGEPYSGCCSSSAVSDWGEISGEGVGWEAITCGCSMVEASSEAGSSWWKASLG